MNRQITRLGIALLACYLALFVKLNWVFELSRKPCPYYMP